GDAHRLAEGDPVVEETPFPMKDRGRDDAIEVVFDGEANEADDGVWAAIDCAVPPPEVSESGFHQIHLLAKPFPVKRTSANPSSQTHLQVGALCESVPR